MKRSRERTSRGGFSITICGHDVVRENFGRLTWRGILSADVGPGGARVTALQFLYSRGNG